MASIIQIDGRWRAQVRRKGHKAYTKTFQTQRQAESWAACIEADIAREGMPRAQSVVGHAITVADMIDIYTKLREDTRPISDASTEHYTLKTLTRHLGSYDVMRLTTDDLVAYATMRAEEAGPYTVNMDISKLGTVMRLVASYKRVTLPDVVGKARPLLSHLKLIGGGGRRERRPTEDELTRIIAELAKRGQIYADIVKFAVLTAMRRAEIVGLLWADLDTDKRLVLVRDRKDPRNKAGNDQWVPLLGDAWELVQAQPRVDARIFPAHVQTTSKYFTWACRDLSIPDLHFHDLRHEGTSRLFEAGYRIEEVSVVTGHKSWVNLKRYTQIRPEQLHREPPK